MGSDQYPAVRAVFDFMRPRLVQIAGGFVPDAEAAVAEASTIFDRMLPDMGYVENPAHPMALPLFFCNANLALYEVLRHRDVDAHAYGRVMLKDLAEHPLPELPDDADSFARLAAAADASQHAANSGEFVFATIEGGPGIDWGMDVLSCAICAQFSKFDAMDLVPYMCASDDVISDANGQGLRRTGTIALGAHRCDFRYHAGGEPLRVSEQYPDRIRSSTPPAP